MSETLLWLSREDGSVTGPHGIVFVRRELNEGNITLDTMAAQDGTEDWIPLEAWGAELYPPETIRRGPRATKVASILEEDRNKVPVGLALTIMVGLAGAVYFAVFYNIGVNTEWGTVANQGKMNTRIVGLIACLGTTAIYILVHIMGKRR
ncbi:MAG: hypothetical protein V4675_14320 [Verrucomicrobiota bacterium]